MTRYIALIRGINVGGNNAVSMSKLKDLCEESGFTAVSTYINSGNVLFSSELADVPKLVGIFERMLAEQFGVTTVVAVIPATELHDAVRHAPEWWGVDEGSKHNVLFVIAPAKTHDIIHQVGEAKPEYEQIAFYGSVIFWSAPIKTFSRTRWSKIVGTKSYDSVTIRNANTVRKLYDMTVND